MRKYKTWMTWRWDLLSADDTKPEPVRLMSHGKSRVRCVLYWCPAATASFFHFSSFRLRFKTVST